MSDDWFEYAVMFVFAAVAIVGWSYFWRAM